MPIVNDILLEKGSTVYTISPGVNVLDAICKMNQHKLGALVVTDGAKVMGIFTERDVLQRVIGAGLNPGNTTVSEVMTTEVHCCPPDTDLDEVSLLMKERRIRHMPVCGADGQLVGMVSIGDLNAFHVGRQEQTITYPNEYIYGRA